MADPKIITGKVANVVTQMFVFEKAGDSKTEYFSDAQVMLLSSGSLKVTVNSKETTFVAPHFIYIDAQMGPQFSALEDNTVACCIYVVRDASGNVIDPTWIP
jgi:hypothetical protein